MSERSERIKRKMAYAGALIRRNKTITNFEVIEKCKQKFGSGLSHSTLKSLRASVVDDRGAGYVKSKPATGTVVKREVNTGIVSQKPATSSMQSSQFKSTKTPTSFSKNWKNMSSILRAVVTMLGGSPTGKSMSSLARESISKLQKYVVD